MLEVKCGYCKKLFFRSKSRINENKKFGQNFYCSKICQFNNQKTGSFLNCENPSCDKKFYRAKNDILKNNYCCRSCAAIVNNKKYPKNSRSIKNCIICFKQFKRDSLYCSRECGKFGRFKYSKDEIIQLINDYYHELGRVPAKRESLNFYRSAEIQFGSWNNAVRTAGLEPNRSHENRMYKRSMTKAKDGHLCDSISEAIIDNWLDTHNISHIRNVGYPATNHRADWAIDKNTFIEYFGLAEDSPRYDQAVRVKKNLCEKHNIQLVEIYARDLYPDNRLDEKLKSFIAQGENKFPVARPS